jgi:hypothetical protein
MPCMAAYHWRSSGVFRVSATLHTPSNYMPMQGSYSMTSCLTISLFDHKLQSLTRRLWSLRQLQSLNR